MGNGEKVELISRIAFKMKVSELLRLTEDELNNLVNTTDKPALDVICAKAILNAMKSGDYKQFD